MRKSPVTTRLAAISLAAIAGLTACGTSHRAPIHPASTGPAITDPMTLVADMGGTATYPEQTLPSGDKQVPFQFSGEDEAGKVEVAPPGMTLAKLYGGTPRSAPGWAVITSTDPNNAWYISVTEPASGIWAEDPSVLAADTGGYLQDGLTG